MVICPKCKAENRPEAAFCANCGAILLAHPTPAIQTPTEQSQPEQGSSGPVILMPAATESVPGEAGSSDTGDTGPAELASEEVSPSVPPIPQPAHGAPSVDLGPASGFQPRPEGSLIEDRYHLTSVLTRADHEIQYEVTEECQATGPCVRICSNPGCRAVHTPLESFQEKFCTVCGSPMEQNSPLLLLKEADIDRFSDLQPLIDLHLVHPNIHPPILLISQEVEGAARYGMLRPYSEDLPAQSEVSQVLEWGLQLAGALDYLQSNGIAFNGEVDPAIFGLLADRIVWRSFESSRLLPMLTDRDKINNLRLLALSLYTWITGKTDYASDPSLSPVLNQLFQRALVGEGFTSGEDLAKQIHLALKSPLSAISLDYQVGIRTHSGRLRENNEDGVLSLSLVQGIQGATQSAGIFAVADGMGGHATGELASSLVIQSISHKALSEINTLQDLTSREYSAWLDNLVQASNLAVYEARQEAGTDMGSTLACVLILGNMAFIANQGDSRIYLVRDRSIQQLTTDHSLVQHLVSIGQISSDEARNHPQRNMIYRSLGEKPQAEADLSTQHLLPGDKLLLCSDGLSGMLDDLVLKDIIVTAPSPQVACDRLVEAANMAGGDDNISVIVVDVSSKQAWG